MSILGFLVFLFALWFTTMTLVVAVMKAIFSVLAEYGIVHKA